MATDASSVANICIPRGKGIGGVMADLLTPEKKDRNATKSLADLSKLAKHLESAEVEACNLKQKSSQQGTKTTKKAQMSNILTDEETKKRFEWEGKKKEGFHPICTKILKREREASQLADLDWLIFDDVTPVENIDDDIEDIEMLELEIEILAL